MDIGWGFGVLMYLIFVNFIIYFYVLFVKSNVIYFS